MTLVLLPPIGLDAACWDWLELPELPTVRHEFPGFGGRPRAAEPPTMASLADEVAATCAGKLDAVGVSLGGMVAQHLALRHPGRVRSLVVACTGAAADAKAMRDRAAAVEAGGMESLLEATLERWFTPSALAEEPERPAVSYARRALLALDPSAFADGWRAIAGHDVRDRLHEIEVPVTCVAGAADVAWPVRQVQEVAERLPRSRLVVLEGPHMLQLERPAQFSAAVREHLRWAGG